MPIARVLDDHRATDIDSEITDADPDSLAPVPGSLSRLPSSRSRMQMSSFSTEIYEPTEANRTRCKELAMTSSCWVAREIGRSAILIDDTLLLDFGMDSGTPPSFPIGDVDPDAVVVSHGHLDHVGSVPAFLSGDAAADPLDATDVRPHDGPRAGHAEAPRRKLRLSVHRGGTRSRRGSLRDPRLRESLPRPPATKSPFSTPATFPVAPTFSSMTARRDCSTPATSTPKNSGYRRHDRSARRRCCAL